MPTTLFWQRPIEWWDWQTLQDFLAEGLPENQRLEYKRPHFNKQSGRWEPTPELVETLVAYANTDEAGRSWLDHASRA